MPASASAFLNVHDIRRSLDFYKKLGFKVDKEWKDDAGKTGWADLSFQGADLGLGNIASNDDQEFRDWVSGHLGAGVIVMFTVPSGTVDKVFASAKKAGATIEFEPMDRPYGRILGLNDPDGYVVHFHEEVRKSAKRAAKSSKKAAKKAGAKKAGKKAAKKPAKRSR